MNDLRRIGVAYNATAESAAALAWARALAEQTHAELELFIVAEPIAVGLAVTPTALVTGEMVEDLNADIRRQLDEALASLPPSLHATGHVLEGAAGPKLAEAAGDVDLLVVGSRGYGPLGRLLLGSVSHSVLHHARTPVVVVPRAEVPSASMGDPVDANPVPV